MGKYREKCLWVEVSKIERFIEELKREAKREKNFDKPMTAGQLAKFLNIHRYEVYRMVRNDGLPVIELGPRKFRFDPKEVQKWMQSRVNRKNKVKAR